MHAHGDQQISTFLHTNAFQETFQGHVHKENLLNKALQWSIQTTKKPLHQLPFQEKLPNYLLLHSHFSSRATAERQVCPLIQVWCRGREGGDGVQYMAFSMVSLGSPGLWGREGEAVWREEGGGGSLSLAENNSVSVFSNTKCIILSSRSQLTAWTKNNITVVAVECSTLLVQMHV